MVLVGVLGGIGLAAGFALGAVVCCGLVVSILLLLGYYICLLAKWERCYSCRSNVVSRLRVSESRKRRVE